MYDELKTLTKVLDLPPSIACENGVTEDEMTSLAMLCKRLSWPLWLCDLELTFEWECSHLSRITNYLTTYIFDWWKHLLQWDSTRLTPAMLSHFPQAIQAASCLQSNVVASLMAQCVAQTVQNQHILEAYERSQVSLTCYTQWHPHTSLWPSGRSAPWWDPLSNEQYPPSLPLYSWWRTTCNLCRHHVWFITTSPFSYSSPIGNRDFTIHHCILWLHRAAMTLREHFWFRIVQEPAWGHALPFMQGIVFLAKQTVSDAHFFDRGA